jgi:hypothetical protein
VTSPRIVLVGGAGAFGSRLAQTLIGSVAAEIVIAGRSLDRATTAARRLGAHGALALDRLSCAQGALAGATIVVDAAGPFQGASFDFARRVLASGAHYVDLADARDFVAAFPAALDAAARAAGRIAVTGASSTPALTHAALDAMTASWTRIDRIVAGISAGAKAPRGRAAIEAILSWAGGPVRVFVDGAWRARAGWRGTRRIEIDGLGFRRFALAETADLDLFVDRYAPTDQALFLAGLESPHLHHGLSAVAWLRRAGLAPSLRPLAGAAQWIAKCVVGGGDRGGMFVEVWGRDAGDRPTRGRWTLTAPPGVGPYVPGLPAAAVVRRILKGDVASGARTCAGLVALSELADDFVRLGVLTRTDIDAVASPFEVALGERFEVAPAVVRRVHRSGPVARLVGEADVKGPATPLAAVAARLVGFPRAATAAPVEVTMRALDEEREEWVRVIGGARFRSVLRAVGDGMVEERFGPLTFRMRLDVDADSLRMDVTGWRIGVVPLPAWLAPRSAAREAETAEGRFSFDVPIAAPVVGRLVHYAGALTLSASPCSARTPAARGSVPGRRVRSG